VFVLVVLAMQAQVLTTHTKGVAMAEPPLLPVVTKNVLPGEVWVLGMWKVKGATMVYDTWRPRRNRITMLPPGKVVTALSGLSVVNRPDSIVVTSAVPGMEFHAGDALLRYTPRGEGFADFWANGRWYSISTPAS
jgi:hypothetical protein